MKRILFCLVMLTFAISVGAQVAPAPALMNFQGRLARPDGTPVANGNYTIRFSLWNANAGGAEQWNQTVNPVAVRNGTFAVLLSGFTAGTFNANRWLEIKVGGDAPLTPRQQLVTVAYAFKANSVADGAITSASIADGAITAADIAPDGFNTLSWLLGGNTGTNPATQFLGTRDNQPLNFRVNNQRALRLEYVNNTIGNNIYFGSNVIGGFLNNSVADGVIGATIAGGGLFLDGIGRPNQVFDIGGTVGGGRNNHAGSDNASVVDAFYATVSGGRGNLAGNAYSSVGGGDANTASDAYATVGGGVLNNASGFYSTVAGGNGNTASGLQASVTGGNSNVASGQSAFVGNGFSNESSGENAVIGGGENNSASSNHTSVLGGQNNAASASFATVGGGFNNRANDFYATVAGGLSNLASGTRATIPGGELNTAAGAYALAAGYRAKANHTGAFVWADSALADFASSASNQFLIRASGGVGIGTNNPLTALHVVGALHLQGTTQDISYPTSENFQFGEWDGTTFTERMRISGSGNVGIGTTNPTHKLHVNGSVAGVGAYNNLSDARYKQNVATFPDALDAVLNLRGVGFDWRRSEFPGMNFSAGRQIGFIAQEVEKILPELVTTDAEGIKTVAYASAVPVLVEAIKQQQQQIVSQQKQIDTLKSVKAENGALKTRLDALASQVERLLNAQSPR